MISACFRISAAVKIHVLLFGVLKDFYGAGREHLVLADGATVEAVAAHYRAQAPQHQALLAAIAFAVNREFAPLSTPLHDGDEVALLPPVSGGGGGATAYEVRLVHAPIAVAELQDRIRQKNDGAICVFEGIVRNHTRGRQTLYLDYESYEEMAQRELERIVQQALERFSVREVIVHHRLGRIEISQASVFIAIASAHRAAAFEACRWLIDTLKKQVPIWKKEHFVDGTVWADGEPFPEEVRG
ncbi:MAG: molybdenum cofactor biosynthesis protein MoaE [Acidobacteriaceae bacterium]